MAWSGGGDLDWSLAGSPARLFSSPLAGPLQAAVSKSPLWSSPRGEVGIQLQQEGQ